MLARASRPDTVYCYWAIYMMSKECINMEWWDCGGEVRFPTKITVNWTKNMIMFWIILSGTQEKRGEYFSLILYKYNIRQKKEPQTRSWQPYLTCVYTRLRGRNRETRSVNQTQNNFTQLTPPIHPHQSNISQHISFVYSAQRTFLSYPYVKWLSCAYDCVYRWLFFSDKCNINLRNNMIPRVI